MPSKDSTPSTKDVSMEEYEKIRAEVRDLVAKKKNIDRNLVSSGKQHVIARFFGLTQHALRW